MNVVDVSIIIKFIIVIYLSLKELALFSKWPELASATLKTYIFVELYKSKTHWVNKGSQRGEHKYRCMSKEEHYYGKHPTKIRYAAHLHCYRVYNKTKNTARSTQTKESDI